MKLFTKAIEAELIKNHKATEDSDGSDLHHVPVVKLFDPYGSATWLLTEYNPEDDLAYGLCDLGMGSPELGYVSMAEIKSLMFHGVPRIERDMHWDADKCSIGEFAARAKQEGRIISYLYF